MRLTEIEVDEVSLVDKAANRKKFAFIKRDATEDEKAAAELALAVKAKKDADDAAAAKKLADAAAAKVAEDAKIKAEADAKAKLEADKKAADEKAAAEAKAVLDAAEKAKKDAEAATAAAELAEIEELNLLTAQTNELTEAISKL